MIFNKLFGRAKPPQTGPSQIESRIAGPLLRDKELMDWWKGNAIAIPFFDGKLLAVTFSGLDAGDAASLSEYDAALANFLKLGADARASATPHVHKNCRDYLAMADWDGKAGLSAVTERPDSVWAFVTPREIIVTRRLFEDMDVYVEADCDCAWEAEHGLTLVFRQGRQLTRVSPMDGHLTDADACNIPDSEDKLLSAWKG